MSNNNQTQHKPERLIPDPKPTLDDLRSAAKEDGTELQIDLPGSLHRPLRRPGRAARPAIAVARSGARTTVPRFNRSRWSHWSDFAR